MTSHAVSHRCPWCRREHDRLSDFTSTGPPRDGDVAFCIACGEFAIYEAGALRKPTDDEFTVIGFDDNLRKLRMAWTIVDGMRRGDNPESGDGSRVAADDRGKARSGDR